MKRKKSVPTGPKKEVAHREEKKLISSWISFRLLVLFLVLLAGIVWFGFYVTIQRDSRLDDREYASIARNIVNGKGIVRNFIYPVDINFFEKIACSGVHASTWISLDPRWIFKLFGISMSLPYFPPISPILFSSFFFFFFAKEVLGVKTSVHCYSDADLQQGSF